MLPQNHIKCKKIMECSHKIYKMNKKKGKCKLLVNSNKKVRN